MRNKFLKSNKLNPYDDKTEIEPSSRNTSWAITDYQSKGKQFNLDCILTNKIKKLYFLISSS